MPGISRPGLMGHVLPRDLEGLAQMAESSRQRVAPDTAGLAEQPEVQDGGSGQKENGCVCRQLLQPTRGPGTRPAEIAQLATVLLALGNVATKQDARTQQNPSTLDSGGMRAGGALAPQYL